MVRIRYGGRYGNGKKEEVVSCVRQGLCMKEEFYEGVYASGCRIFILQALPRGGWGCLKVNLC